MPTAHTATFRLLHQAILAKKPVVCTYQNRRREICPYILGHKDGVETVLAFQFGGESSRGLPSRGDWKCFRVADVAEARLRDGPWRGESRHSAAQRCVDDVFVDVNTDVPNQPGRR